MDRSEGGEMKLGVLGRVVMWDDAGTEVAMRPQVRRLLALFGARDFTVTQDEIAEYVVTGARTGSAARTAAGRLRSVVGDRLVTVGAAYELLLDSDELDAAVFQRLVERTTGARAADRVEMLSAALDEWRGPAFGDLADEPWVAPAAAALEQRRRTAVEDLAEALIECGRWPDAVARLERHLSDAPYQERPVALLMRAHAGAGRTTDALRCFRSFRLALRDDIGVEPSRDLSALEAELLGEADPAGERPALGPDTGVRGTSPGFPDPPSSFIGRTEEVKGLVDDLVDRRLVTLTGVGGAGKTRLAIEVAREASDGFPDGVWFVDLATITETTDVAVLAATAMGVQLESGIPALACIIDHLRTRCSLVVVDNCEHVLAPASAFVAAVVNGCHSTRILATSRERLGVEGESVHPVVGLDDLESHDLFCARAVDADDRFAPSDEDRPVIDTICGRLDGIPLAIELAAARTQALTPADVLDRLDDRFRLLRGRRSHVERHETLAAAIAWSYDLLDADERDVFERLSVFPGDFDRAAASAVCVAGDDRPADPRRVDDVLDSLVAKSLVGSDRSGRHTRHRILESLREFGSTRLEDRGLTLATRDRHRLHFLEVSQDIRRRNATTFDDMSGFAMVRRDWHNFRAAVSWSLDADEPRQAMWTALLPPVFYLFLDEHADWVGTIIDRLPPDDSGACLGLAYAALWGTLRGENAAAFEHGRRGLQLGGPPAAQRILWWAVGEAHLNTGNPVEGLAAARRALTVGAEVAAPPDMEVVNPLELCCMCALSVEPDAVSGFAGRLTAVARDAPSKVHRAIASNGVGFALLAAGDVDGALRRFRETIEIASGVAHMHAEGWKNLAVAVAWSEPDDAPEILREALDRLAHSGMWSFVWVVVEALAIHWSRRGRVTDAAVLLGYLEQHGLAFGILVDGRRELATAVEQDPGTRTGVERGRSMGRSDIVDFALDRFQER